MSKEIIVSKNEKDFILGAIKEGIRVDGRTPVDYRKININFGVTAGTVEVQLGKTRVLACVTAEIATPLEDRPNEGFLNFHVDCSPMASPSFEESRPSDVAVAMGRVVDRGIRDSGAIDVEALCILAGEKVWNIRVDLHALDDCGNLLDCASIAALAGLLHFRRPDVTVTGDRVTVHSIDDKQPVPIALHHKPVAISFALYDDGEAYVIDPIHKEELTCEGTITMTLNSHQEVCALQKPGGVAIGLDVLMKMTEIAAIEARKIIKLVEDKLKAEAAKPQNTILASESQPILDVFEEVDRKHQEINLDDISEQKVKKEDEMVEEKEVVKEVKKTRNLFEGGESLWGDTKTLPVPGKNGVADEDDSDASESDQSDPEKKAKEAEFAMVASTAKEFDLSSMPAPTKPTPPKSQQQKGQSKNQTKGVDGGVKKNKRSKKKKKRSIKKITT